MKRLLSPLLLLALACVALAGCVARPDLARLYENSSSNPDQPPVIIIHGLAGSTLVDAVTGKEFWPGSLGTLTFGNYRDLAQMSREDREGEGLVPGALFASVAGVDFYGALLNSLESVGHFKRGVPGEPVTSSDRRRYYVLLYDWRKDNVLAVRKLHALIEQIRSDYRDPNLRVDIIAHSNGGLIADYYLRYGPTDVLGQDRPTPWAEGDRRVRRLVMLGTPALGAVTSLERLIYGTRMAVRTVPVEVMATFATPFQALPHPKVRWILDPSGKPMDLDIYDDAVWREHRWGVFSPEVIARVSASMSSPQAGEQAVRDIQATFVSNLQRARGMKAALSAPFPTDKVDIAVFGGDCEATPSHAVLIQDGDGQRLVFRPGQVDPKKIGELRKGRGGPDYERLMYEPGDGLVTRSSMLGRDVGPDGADLRMLPAAQTFFLCESHGRLTHNLYFQNNLLYFLLAR